MGQAWGCGCGSGAAEPRAEDADVGVARDWPRASELGCDRGCFERRQVLRREVGGVDEERAAERRVDPDAAVLLRAEDGLDRFAIRRS